LRAALKLARDDVEESGDKGGGRQADARLRIFISNLGMIYETAANQTLTCSVDPMSGGLNSPFGLFVLEALRFFYPEREIPIGAVRTLVQRLARFEPDAAKREGSSGGGLCFGYDVVRTLDARGEPVRGGRSINPAEGAIILRIFKDFSAGQPPRSIAKALNRDSIPGPRGAEWGPSTISPARLPSCEREPCEREKHARLIC
jgi:hypothetical protein